VENRAPNDLAPLEPQAAPQEVRTLATALNQLLAAVQESVAAQKRFMQIAAEYKPASLGDALHGGSHVLDPGLHV
jgi:hypothetical protein